MDPERLKRIDKYLGTPILLLLGQWELLIQAVSAGRSASGGKLEGISRIAVVKMVAIGDLVVALPTLAAIRRRFPDAHITLVTTPRVHEVVEGLETVDEILYFDVFGRHKSLGGVMRFAREIRAAAFDAWIELEHYYRFTTILGHLSGARVRVGFDVDSQVRRRSFTIGVPYPADAHEVEAFYAIARALGAADGPGRLLPIPASERDHDVAREWLSKSLANLGVVGCPPPIAVLHTTTSPIALGRRWPADRWAELARRLRHDCGLIPVLTGAPDDVEALRRLADLMGPPVLVAAGALTLKQFSVLAGLARLVVSLDTGPLHVAAATGTPTVGLFGPNTPAKWGPYGARHAAVWAGLACSPCTRQYLGQVSTCTRDDCMRAIKVEDVLSAVKSLPSNPCTPSPESVHARAAVSRNGG